MEFSIVIPCYLQAETIVAEITQLKKFLSNMVTSYEIIVVIDGNQDNTLKKIQSMTSLSHIRIELFLENYGKGSALQHGLLQAQGDIVGFIDAGGDIDHTTLQLMVDLMEFSQADIVIGSKRHPLSHVTYPRIRRFYSWGYQALNRILFNLNVKDTQVGLKLFRKEVLRKTLPQLLVKRFAFDLELLVVAHDLGFHHIIEAPVTITHTFKSTVNMHSVAETLKDTLAIFYRRLFTTVYKTQHHLPIAAKAIVSYQQPKELKTEKEVSRV